MCRCITKLYKYNKNIRCGVKQNPLAHFAAWTSNLVFTDDTQSKIKSKHSSSRNILLTNQIYGLNNQNTFAPRKAY